MPHGRLPSPCHSKTCAARKLRYAMKHVLNVNQVTPLQPKVYAHTKEFLCKHGHIKPVAVEPSQITTMQPFQKAWRDSSKCGGVFDIFIVHPVNQA